MKMNILLLDIDHTISDAAWRDDMIASGNWDEYHLAGKEDVVVEEIAELIKSLIDWEIICVTARPEKWRTQTMQWFIRHRIPVTEILMRPNDGYSSAPETKVQLLRKRFGDNLDQLEENNVIIMDDNEKVIEAMRSLGITTMQVTISKRRK